MNDPAKAEPSIVPNEGGVERRERRRADAGASQAVDACVGSSRASAKGTRGGKDSRTMSSPGVAGSESDSSHASENGNSNAIAVPREMNVYSKPWGDAHAIRCVSTDGVRIHARGEAGWACV